MAQTTVQIPASNSFTSVTYSSTPSQIHIDERRGRYPGTSRQQPDQASPVFYNGSTQVSTRAEPNLLEVNQGLKGLHDKIDNILKRSTSTNRTKPNHDNAVTIKPSVPRPIVQNENQIEVTQRTAESFFDSRSLASPSSSYHTAKYAPNNMSSASTLRENFGGFSMQSPQASSRFYLGGFNSHAVRTDVTHDLLNSIKSYQVKTIHTLNASMRPSGPHNYSQEIPQNRSAVPLGSSSLLLNTSNVPSEGFQSGYDRDMISNIMDSQQSFNGNRPESFFSTSKLTDLTIQDSMLTSKLYEPRVVVQEHKIKAPQHLRPAKKTQPANKVQKPVSIEKKQFVTKQNKKDSCCDDFEPDGDSMILQFIREKDEFQLLDDDEEDARPSKRVREVEEDEPFVKKVSKRQEILSSKRQVRREGDRPQKVRKNQNVKATGAQKSTNRI